MTLMVVTSRLKSLIVGKVEVHVEAVQINSIHKEKELIFLAGVGIGERSSSPPTSGK